MTQIGQPKRIIEIPLPTERPSTAPSETPSEPIETPEPVSPVSPTPSEPLVPA